MSGEDGRENCPRETCRDVDRQVCYAHMPESNAAKQSSERVVAANSSILHKLIFIADFSKADISI